MNKNTWLAVTLLINTSAQASFVETTESNYNSSAAIPSYLQFRYLSDQKETQVSPYDYSWKNQADNLPYAWIRKNQFFEICDDLSTLEYGLKTEWKPATEAWVNEHIDHHRFLSGRYWLIGQDKSIQSYSIISTDQQQQLIPEEGVLSAMPLCINENN